VADGFLGTAGSEPAFAGFCFVGAAEEGADTVFEKREVRFCCAGEPTELAESAAEGVFFDCASVFADCVPFFAVTALSFV
jgi:hypothetical protein